MSNSMNVKKKGIHQLVASEEEMIKLISEELKNTTQEELVIMSGHFMLFFDEETNSLTPGIIEEQKTDVMKERISRRVGIFPLYTWNIGIQLGEQFYEQFRDIKYLLLINDWQYVPSTNTSVSDLRKEFYERYTEIPEAYVTSLEKSKYFNQRNILSSRKNPIFFPETWLKYRFQKSASKLVKEGKLEKRMLNDRENQSEVSFVDADGNYKTLISCGVTGCAGEITEMIAEVHKAGYRALLLFAPGECYQPVRTGIEIALNLYNLTGMKVIVVDPGGSGEMSKEEIYEKTVNFSVFSS
ncbi:MULTISPECIES: LPD16 domain-containing protein [unclassified Bacillus (in: firmicutes)]|uniref:LPD16 domain-containing protein n=1 Tax=unclassified Bacillus (in: firmicutes) TaxID=185979 RepID=UPI0020C5B5EC|nr:MULTISPECIES: LPD16 domain-containing protein [unclassified Bacillus (in: firmicutes)]